MSDGAKTNGLGYLYKYISYAACLCLLVELLVSRANAQDVRSGQGSPAHDSDRAYPVSAKQITLENDAMRVSFDSVTGALTDLYNKRSGWSVEGTKTDDGRSFEMSVPTANRNFNPVMGYRNKLTSYELAKDATHLTLIWDRVVSEYAGELAITLTGHVFLDQTGIHFESELIPTDNRSSLSVETVNWPILGHLSPPKGENGLTRENQNYDALQRVPLLPNFPEEKGYWGVNFPTQIVEYRYVLASARNQGLYVGKHDAAPTDLISREMVRYQFALQPGYADSFHSRTASGITIGDHPIRLTLNAIHFPFVLPGKKTQLSPIYVAPYQGDWHQGVDLYRTWRESWFKRPGMPQWVEGVHSWQELQLNSPEDDLRTTYADLYSRAQQAAKHGVTALHLIGWNNGGQDRGNPSHDTDPRLGSQKEFKDVIHRIETELNLRVILFNKYTWADMTTDWYGKELLKHVATDPYGIPYQFAGYQYQTPVQLANLNTRRFAPGCMLDPFWLDMCEREFQKSLDLGASGILFDEAAWHGGTSYCYSKDHGHQSPAYIYGGDIQLGQRLRNKISKSVGEKHFLLSGEELYDAEDMYYSLAYFRIGNGHVPSRRYADPFLPMLVTVAGFDDRETINHALLDRYIICYEPFNFKGDLDDMPLTMEYGRKVDALRTRYHESLWDAEFRDNQGVLVSRTGGLDIEYTAFKQHDGKFAVVVVNDNASATLKAHIIYGNPASRSTVATPENPEKQPLLQDLTVPPRSAAVVFEE